MVGLISGLYRLGVLGMHTVERGHDTTELSRRFVHSLIPIALAYVVAHYFSLLMYQGQAVAYLVSDPLGDGSNVFGTATATINYNLVGANGVWYVQVFALPLAHAGHWYHALLYLAPVLIVVVVLWVQERRERGRDPDARIERDPDVE
jgi:hypothetical protein